MPTSKSAKKRMKTAEQRRVANRAVKAKIRTLRGKFLKAIEAGDAEAAAQGYNAFSSAMDKAAKKNILKANTVARYKSRAAHKIKALTTTD
jgi:small subunit ribosomal protein S20